MANHAWMKDVLSDMAAYASANGLNEMYTKLCPVIEAALSISHVQEFQSGFMPTATGQNSSVAEVVVDFPKDQGVARTKLFHGR